MLKPGGLSNQVPHPLPTPSIFASDSSQGSNPESNAQTIRPPRHNTREYKHSIFLNKNHFIDIICNYILLHMLWFKFFLV